ncbi:MAG: hypothetical protein ACRDTT_25835, partial [Pseudonocardiaceae bacterium]
MSQPWQREPYSALTQPRVAAAAVATLTVLTAGYGTAGRADFVWYSVLQAWAVGALLWQTVPISRRSRRSAFLSRVLMWSSLPALGLQQIAYVLGNQRADVLTVVAWAALLIGIELGASASDRLHRALRRLADRAVLRSGDTTAELERTFGRVGSRWAAVGVGSVTLLLLLVTWPRAAEFAARWDSWSIGPAVADQVLVVVAGATAGGLLGRLAGYGRLGTVLTKHSQALVIIPGHPDRAAGLKPIGDFYLYQSLVASVPAIFLAGWVLLVVLAGAKPEIGRYQPYLDQYLALLIVAVAFEVLVFLLPIRSVHTMMKRYKEEILLSEADRLSVAIEALRARLADGQDDEWERNGQRLALLLERRDHLEKTPTWPWDPSIRRQFT